MTMHLSPSPRRYLLVNTTEETVHEVRDTWELAAQDAVAAGVGRWDNPHEFKLDFPWQIRAVKE